MQRQRGEKGSGSFAWALQVFFHLSSCALGFGVFGALVEEGFRHLALRSGALSFYRVAGFQGLEVRGFCF